MSEFWFYFFASVLLFSYSYWRVSLSTFRPSSSLNLQSTSYQTSGAPLCTESQDSEHTVIEVAVRGTEYAVADLLTPEVTVAMAADSFEGLAVASQEVALVVPSLPRPASPSPLLASGGPPLADDVVQQFDATHRLSELTAA